MYVIIFNTFKCLVKLEISKQSAVYFKALTETPIRHHIFYRNGIPAHFHHWYCVISFTMVRMVADVTETRNVIPRLEFKTCMTINS